MPTRPTRPAPPSTGRPGVMRRRRELRVTPRRRLAWRRRRVRQVLSATFASVGAVVVMGAVQAPDQPAGVPVLVAVREVAAGAVLQPEDVEIRSWPEALAPSRRLSRAAEAVGRAVTIPLGTGEPVTAGRVVTVGALSGLRASDVAMSVTGVDPTVLAVVRAGDHVDVLSPGTGETVAEAALVLVDPPRGSPDSPPSDASLLVAVNGAEAKALARLRTELDVGSLVVIRPRAGP